MPSRFDTALITKRGLWHDLSRQAAGRGCGVRYLSVCANHQIRRQVETDDERRRTGDQEDSGAGF